ncbi:hypothetical protein [Candidatus Sneabacter namystus]|uniref:Uncharacterized protein n=1 Tax=Candidatus Sneabacter namystus TaxID=2601646 RepID=A0A5C0UHV0_9RICK|nr:hypothetical protein [Candidatus Sneabacter namystus]QEK39337.1 hypothetical protein FZC37_00030 [Candidatus Sneabacter namystus]
MHKTRVKTLDQFKESVATNPNYTMSTQPFHISVTYNRQDMQKPLVCDRVQLHARLFDTDSTHLETIDEHISPQIKLLTFGQKDKIDDFVGRWYDINESKDSILKAFAIRSTHELVRKMQPIPTKPIPTKQLDDLKSAAHALRELTIEKPLFFSSEGMCSSLITGLRMNKQQQELQKIEEKIQELQKIEEERQELHKQSEDVTRKPSKLHGLVSIDICDYLPHPSNIHNRGPYFLKLEFFSTGQNAEGELITPFLNHVMSAKLAVEHCRKTCANWPEDRSMSQHSYRQDGKNVYSCLFSVTPSVEEYNDFENKKPILQRQLALKAAGFVHYNSLIKNRVTNDILNTEESLEGFKVIHNAIFNHKYKIDQEVEKRAVETVEVNDPEDPENKFFTGKVNFLIQGHEKQVEIFFVNLPCGDAAYNNFQTSEQYNREKEGAIHELRQNEHFTHLSTNPGIKDKLLDIIGSNELFFSEISEKIPEYHHTAEQH